MNTDRKTAIFVGIFFLLGFAGVITAVMTAPILGAPDYLSKISASENLLLLGALFQIIMAAACAAIGIGLYPVLRKYNESLALGAVGFRIIEAAFLVVPALGYLALVALSQAYVKAGAPEAAYFQTLGTLIQVVSDHGGNFGLMAFTVAALMYYYVFFQSRLLPRWLSGWGFLAAASTLVVALFVMFGADPFASPVGLLNIPLVLNEPILAVWLIGKGFNPAAIASKPA